MYDADVMKLLKCLADSSRIRIIKALMKDDMYVERLAERLALTPATISFHLKKLEEAGFVTSYREQYYIMYSLRKETLFVNLYDMLAEDYDEEGEQDKREEEYRQKVIAAFFEYGKLKTIPAQRKKERIVLEEIAKKLENGRFYSEQEINQMLLQFHEDYCTLRRDMIAEKILARDGKKYWKC